MDIIILIIIIVSIVRKTRKKSVKKRPSTVREANRNTEILRQQQMRQQEMQRQQQMRQQEMQRQQQMRQQQMQRQQQWQPARQQSVQLQQDVNKQRELKKRLEEKYGQGQNNNTILNNAMNHVVQDSTDVMKARDKMLHDAAGGISTQGNTINADMSGDARMNKVYDLMITGYDGNLNFERDFLGESMDMLNRIQNY